jgi:hypothetical protein|eukprot:g907.t1
MKNTFLRGRPAFLLCAACALFLLAANGDAFATARGKFKRQIDHSKLPPNSGAGPFVSRASAKAGLKNNWLKLDDKAKRVDVLIDPDPQEPDVLPTRSPPAPGTRDGPVPAGYVGGCCTICTKNFYRSLALLQLPAAVETETLRRFHKTYEKHLVRYPAPSLLEERETPDKALDESVGKDTEDSGLEQGDLVHDIKEATNTYKAVGEDAHRVVVGQEGTGPCCNICPASFVPFNNAKLAAKGEVSLPSGDGVDPADGKAFAPTTFLEELAKAGGEGDGTGRCCAVCVDSPGKGERRDRNSLPVSFAEVKATVLAAGGAKATVAQEEGNRPRPGMCCTMCSEGEEDRGGGWPGMNPFSEPMSEDQAIETQANNEQIMHKIAHLRIFHHDSTVSSEYKEKASGSSKMLKNSKMEQEDR